MPAASFQPQTIDLSASFVQLIRTALSFPKVTLDKTGLKSYDASGNLVLAINADGTANFSGHVAAQGLDLNAAAEGVTPSQSMVRWLRASGAVGSEVIGQTQEGDPSARDTLTLTAILQNLVADSLADLVLNAGASGTSESSLFVHADHATDANTAIFAQVWNRVGTKVADFTIADALGQSSFPRLATVSKEVRYGPFSFNSGAIAPQTEVTVAASVPGINPAATAAEIEFAGIMDGSFSARVTWRHEGVNLATASDTFHLFNATAAGGPNSTAVLTFYVWANA